MSHSEAPSRLTVGRQEGDLIYWLLRTTIDKFERDWKDGASYMRDMIDTSPRPAWLCSRFTALGQFRRGITAARREESGPEVGAP